MRNPRHRGKILLVFSFIALILTGCGKPFGGSETNKETNTRPKKELTEFERELKSLKTADFDFIFAIKRKDDEPFTKDDKKFVNRKTYKANRRTLTRDDKVIFIGTNYKIDEKDFDELKERFEIEDFSKTEEELKKEETEEESKNEN